MAVALALTTFFSTERVICYRRWLVATMNSCRFAMRGGLTLSSGIHREETN
jgi:hypothetical protein